MIYKSFWLKPIAKITFAEIAAMYFGVKVGNVVVDRLWEKISTKSPKEIN